MNKRTFGRNAFHATKSNAGGDMVKSLLDACSKVVPNLRADMESFKITSVVATVPGKKDDPQSPIESTVLAVGVYSASTNSLVVTPIILIDNPHYEHQSFKVDDSTVEGVVVDTDQDDAFLRKHVATIMAKEKADGCKVLSTGGITVPESFWDEEDKTIEKECYAIVHTAMSASALRMIHDVLKAEPDYRISDLTRGIEVNVQAINNSRQMSSDLLPTLIGPKVMLSASLVNSASKGNKGSKESVVHGHGSGGEHILDALIRPSIQYRRVRPERAGSATASVAIYKNCWIPQLIIEEVDMNAAATPGRYFTMIGLMTAFMSLDAIDPLYGDSLRFLNVRSNLTEQKDPKPISKKDWGDYKRDLLEDLLHSRVTVSLAIKTTSLSHPLEYWWTTAHAKSLGNALEDFVGARLPDRLRNAPLIDRHVDVELYGKFTCPHSKKVLPLSECNPQYLSMHGFHKNGGEIFQKYVRSYSARYSKGARAAMREEVYAAVSEHNYEVTSKADVITISHGVVRWIRSSMSDAGVRFKTRNATMLDGLRTNDWMGWHGGSMDVDDSDGWED